MKTQQVKSLPAIEIEPSLHAEIKAEAKSQQRTISGQVKFILTNWMIERKRYAELEKQIGI